MLTPLAILHLVLVEWRWAYLVYYTMFVLIRNVGNTNTAFENAEEFSALSYCFGPTVRDKELEKAGDTAMWGGGDITISGDCSEGACTYSATCTHYSQQNCCLKSDTITYGAEMSYLNYLMILTILAPTALFMLYSICVKKGGVVFTCSGCTFDFNMSREYIVGCQKLQQAKIYKLFLQFVLLECVAISLYGIYRTAEAGTMQPIIVGLIAAVKLIPKAARVKRELSEETYEEGKEKITEHYKGVLNKLIKLTNWNTTTATQMLNDFSEIEVDTFGQDGKKAEAVLVDNVLTIPCVTG